MSNDQNNQVAEVETTVPAEQEAVETDTVTKEETAPSEPEAETAPATEEAAA